MSLHYSDATVSLHHGDCLDVLRTLPDASVDSVVTDPPYGLEFMGKEWDAPWQSGSGTGEHNAGFSAGAPAVPGVRGAIKALPSYTGGTNPTCRNCGGTRNGNDRKGRRACRCETPEFPNTTLPRMVAFQQWCELWAAECLRVLKPGGHLLAFGGTRTWHRLACAVEDAGFEVRDSIAWLYGSGFPKSLDVSKAIDKRRDWALVERLAGEIKRARAASGMSLADMGEAMLAATEGAYGKWYHRGGHMFFETGRSLPSRPEWEFLSHVLPIAPEFVDVYDEAEREVTGQHAAGNPIGTYEFKHGEGKGRTANERRDIPATPAAEQWQGWGTALKPSHEPVCVAVKPHSTRDILAEIGSHLARLEDECRQHASDAARSSAPTPADSPEARTDSAPASAATPPEAAPESATPTGAAAGSSAQTATSASESTGATCWSTVTSWKACWAELCELTSTSTTSTTTGQTTDLRTLWSSMSSLTVTSTPDSPTPRLTSSSIASAVDSLFAATVLSLRATLALSAAGSATGSTPRSPLDAAEGSPAFEPVVVARKPLVGTVAGNVLTHGTGALNIDACRVGTEARPVMVRTTMEVAASSMAGTSTGATSNGETTTAGRWPANVVLDETQADALDEQSGELTSGANPTRRGSDKFREAYGDFKGQTECTPARGADTGGASRFFYVAKADASERPRVNGVAHPTVKPLALMRWLVRLVTPPGGTILEPFAGSGTTVEACILEGFRCIAIEKGAEYLPLIESRIARRRDPVRAVELSGDDAGLFDFIDGEATA